MWIACKFLPIPNKQTNKKPNVQVNFSVILSLSIYLTSQDQHETNFIVMFVK